jgi:hypothetical protein
MKTKAKLTPKPWTVYRIENGVGVPRVSFTTEAEARAWMDGCVYGFKHPEDAFPIYFGFNKTEAA